MYLALYAKQAEVKPSCESILTSAFTNDLGDDNYVPVKELKEFTIPAGVKILWKMASLYRRVFNIVFCQRI